jgi:hypothetical protein
MPPPLIEKRYLGDGVYAGVERGMIKLTTEAPAGYANTIYLEPEVMQALQQYYEDALEAVRRATETEQDHL